MRKFHRLVSEQGISSVILEFVNSMVVHVVIMIPVEDFTNFYNVS